MRLIYDVVELATAVKPYFLDWLLRRETLETLLFLDPDILVMAALGSVHEALGRDEIVLVPHLRAPFPADGRAPDDVAIARAGAYNLGFLGLRPGRDTRRLLAWWQSKVDRHCVSDVGQGLFVDQRWMDLVPGLCPSTGILRDPAVNVAYWNLHERQLDRSGAGFRVDGEPLAFFHFSGYDPDRPDELSRHQDRHRAAGPLRALCDRYRDRLDACGYGDRVPYAWDRFGDGSIITRSMRRAYGDALRRGWTGLPPVRWEEPGEVRTWLATPDPARRPHRFGPVAEAIWTLRSDVQATFPGQLRQPPGEANGFDRWLRSKGGTEEGWSTGVPCDPARLLDLQVGDVFLAYATRPDLRQAFPRALERDLRDRDALARWVREHGVREIPGVEASAAGPVRELDVDRAMDRVRSAYLARPGLREVHPWGMTPGGFEVLLWWFRTNGEQHDLTWSELCGCWARLGSVPEESFLRSAVQTPELRGRLNGSGPGLEEEWGRYRGGEGPAAAGPLTHRLLERCRDPGLISLVRRLASGEPPYRPLPETGLTVVGYHDVGSGVGQGARSLVRAASAVGLSYRAYDLAHPAGSPTCEETRLAGERHRVVVLAANADEIGVRRRSLGEDWLAGCPGRRVLELGAPRLPGQLARPVRGGRRGLGLVAVRGGRDPTARSRARPGGPHRGGDPGCTATAARALRAGPRRLRGGLHVQPRELRRAQEPDGPDPGVPPVVRRASASGPRPQGRRPGPVSRGVAGARVGARRRPPRRAGRAAVPGRGAGLAGRPRRLRIPAPQRGLRAHDRGGDGLRDRDRDDRPRGAPGVRPRRRPDHSLHRGRARPFPRPLSGGGGVGRSGCRRPVRDPPRAGGRPRPAPSARHGGPGDDPREAGSGAGGGDDPGPRRGTRRGPGGLIGMGDWRRESERCHPGCYPDLPPEIAHRLAERWRPQVEPMHERFDNQDTAEWLAYADRCRIRSALRDGRPRRVES